MPLFRNLKGTKGTIEIHNSPGTCYLIPATVVSHQPRQQEWGEILFLRRDAVLADGVTFVENRAADEEIFVLNRHRRWVSLSSHPRTDYSSPRTDRFIPGEQLYEEFPF